MDRTVPQGISRCLGTADCAPFRGLKYIVWRPPSRSCTHPCFLRCCRSFWRFTDRSLAHADEKPNRLDRICRWVISAGNRYGKRKPFFNAVLRHQFQRVPNHPPGRVKGSALAVRARKIQHACAEPFRFWVPIIRGVILQHDYSFSISTSMPLLVGIPVPWVSPAINRLDASP